MGPMDAPVDRFRSSESYQGRAAPHSTQKVAACSLSAPVFRAWNRAPSCSNLIAGQLAQPSKSCSHGTPSALYRCRIPCSSYLNYTTALGRVVALERPTTPTAPQLLPAATSPQRATLHVQITPSALTRIRSSAPTSASRRTEGLPTQSPLAALISHSHLPCRGVTQWFGLEGTLKITQFPPPSHQQGPPPPAQGAQSSIQPGLEHCQGGGSHSFSGQPGPGPHHQQQGEFHWPRLLPTGCILRLARSVNTTSTSTFGLLRDLLPATNSP